MCFQKQFRAFPVRISVLLSFCGFVIFQIVAGISITVTVVDVNDNVPTFTQSEYVINVQPNIGEQEIVATVNVSICICKEVLHTFPLFVRRPTVYLHM